MRTFACVELAAFLSLFCQPTFAVEDGEYQATCHVVLEGRVVLDGVCPVTVDVDPDQEMTEFRVNVGYQYDSGDWFLVKSYYDEADVFWNGGGGGVDAAIALGTLRSEGECWVSTEASVCIQNLQISQYKMLGEISNNTAFRGIFIGQSKEQLSNALLGINRKCLSDEDLDKLSGGHFGNQAKELENTCVIVPLAADLSKYNEDSLELGALAMAVLVNKSFASYVIFNENEAVAFALGADIFEATGMPVQDFIRSIIDNYGLSSGMQSLPEGGWRGYTDKGELVTVYGVQDGAAERVVVTKPASKPTFD